MTCAVFALRAHFVVAVGPCAGDIAGNPPCCRPHRDLMESGRLFALQRPRTELHVRKLLDRWVAA